MSARSSALPRRRARLTARAGVLAALVVVVAVLSIVPLQQLLAQRGEIARLEQDAHRLEDANDALRSQVARLHDPRALERLARECLGMVRPGETAFVTVPKHGDPRPSPC